MLMEVIALPPQKMGKPLRQTANLRGFVFSQLHDHILPKLIARVLKKINNVVEI